jgi:CHAT domain-containing protein
MRQSHVDSTSARAQLFELLIQPIADQLVGASRMVVVTDRELTRLPLSALWDHRTGKYLIESIELTLLPSAEFLARRSRADLHQPATTLVVGDPSPHRDTLDLPPLPGAAHEADRVAAVYAKHHLLTGPNASRRRVLEWLQDASVFHFAGHAVDNAGQPELSYLALAAENPTDSDELRTGEIGRMRLTNLRVAVLSACTTLNPRATRIGPVEGLAYSFLRAGAQATIGTLWDVADDSGEELLVNLHRALIAGTQASAALRSAQLDALHGKTGSTAPIHWAAYVVTGF